MKLGHPLLGQRVEIYVPDRAHSLSGKLIEWGQDMLVLHNGKHYIYIPLLQLSQMQAVAGAIGETDDPQSNFELHSEHFSYRNVLMNAKGMFSEICINGQPAVHGYLSSVMNDFFVFCSPAHHSIMVTLKHLKYLIPYSPNVNPYALTPDQIPLKPTPFSLARTFEQQMNKLVDQFVILNLGEDPNKIGLLKGIHQNIIELSNAAGESVYVHLDHVQTIHVP
ncbi:hypothetical protein GCM10010911_03200 [Paenibacillus nasutitermitis]|uniref:DUF2642 domain-containing protein n=1 Tax=Paenibacillus nasutitermitis TaxID=1652958 RepID=A0A916YJN2_9BACL|nr:hypothetical protein GCM10010911_03200 [Paenibacillus nasutitermitis]